MACKDNKILFEFLFADDRTVHVQSSDGTIIVTKLVTTKQDIFDLSVYEKQQLTGTLTLTPSANQLIGTSTNVTMDWTWLKNGSQVGVIYQELDEGDGLLNDLGDAALRTYDALNITRGTQGYVTFRVYGDDGLGFVPHSTATLTKTLLFNDYVYKGELAADLSVETEVNMVAAIGGLPTAIPNIWGSGIVDSFTGTGNGASPKYYYYAFPAYWDSNNWFEDETKSSLAGFFQEGDGGRSGFFIIGTYSINGVIYKIYQSVSNYLEEITYDVKNYIQV